MASGESVGGIHALAMDECASIKAEEGVRELRELLGLPGSADHLEFGEGAQELGVEQGFVVILRRRREGGRGCLRQQAGSRVEGPYSFAKELPIHADRL